MEVEALVSRSLGGDLDAFTELVERHERMAFGYACSILREVETAEDATQNALISAYRNLGSLRDPDKFGSWLRGIVRFESLRLLRTHRQSTAVQGVSDQHADAGNDLAVAFDERESLERVTEALDVLPEHERVAVILFYIQDQSQRDVARFLGLPVSTVNNRLRAARKHLREGDVLLMHAKSSSQGKPRNFAKGIGEVLRMQGNVVDARFAGQDRPALLDSVLIGDRDQEAMSAVVCQYLDDDAVRLVVTENDSQQTGIQRGEQVFTDRPRVPGPMATSAVRDLIASTRRPAADIRVLDTGIKVIDLFAPVAACGTFAIIGDMNVGKMVLVEELFHRLGHDQPDLTILVFLKTPDELGVVQHLDYRDSGHITAVFIPVADASQEALKPALRSVDSVVTMSSVLAAEHHYPAIDPSRSWSSGNVIAQERELVQQARLAFGGKAQSNAEMESLKEFLAQPFFVTEAFTGHDGTSISRTAALGELREILNCA